MYPRTLSTVAVSAPNAICVSLYATIAVVVNSISVGPVFRVARNKTAPKPTTSTRSVGSEVGSSSAYGAHAPILPAILERIVLATGGDRERYHQAIAGSLCISADMAHAVHPNYMDRHEANHRPVLNGGPVIKSNAQQRYATCSRTAALFQELCRRAEVPVQHYAHRTDLPCGSTIGPITATLLGIPTVDVGSPMLSMHSARELGGSADPELMTRALCRFFSWPDTV